MDYLACARLVRALADGPDAFLAALAGDPAAAPTGGTAGSATAASAFDAAAFLAFARTHRLVAWVAPALGDPRVAARVPLEVHEAVATEAAAARARTDDVVGETFEAVDALEAAGVETRVLKGVGFGTRLYGDLTRRYQRDVDVLVRPADVDRAVAAIEALGYAKEEARIGAGAVRRGFRRGKAALDLHWNLRRRSRRQIDTDALFRAPVRFEVRGRTLSTLDDEATLTFLLLALVGDLRRGGCRARHLLDLHLALRTLGPGRDPDAFLARREAQGLGGPCVNVLAVFLGVWGVAGALPAVVRAVEARRRQVVVADAAEALAVVTRPPDDPANETWFRRAYPYDRFGAWARALTVDLPWTLRRRFTRPFTVPPDARPAGAPASR